MDLKDKETKDKAKEAEKPAEPAAKEATPAAAPAAKESEGATDDKGREKSKKRWEPSVVNSRAAAFESAPTVKRDVSVLFVLLSLAHFMLNFATDPTYPITEQQPTREPT
jgi:hypothetical protein